MKREAKRQTEAHHTHREIISEIKQRASHQEMIYRQDFYVFAIPKAELIDIGVLMFDSLGLIEDFDISTSTLVDFFHSLSAQYQNNPYHNFQHAFDVAQMCFFFINHQTVRNYLTKLDVLALM